MLHNTFLQEVVLLRSKIKSILITCYLSCLLSIITSAITPRGINKLNLGLLGFFSSFVGLSLSKVEDELNLKLQDLNIQSRVTAKEIYSNLLKDNNFSVTLSDTAPLENIQLNFFNFEELKLHPDKYPHIRVLGKTGVGKTRFTEYLMDILGGEQFIITPKRKPSDWKNHKVFGYPFNYEECEAKLKEIHGHMYERYKLIEQNQSLHQLNFVVDEWKLINSNIPTARELMKEIIVVARDAKIRMIILAQSENVKSWGLDGESDLEECFTSIRFGDFATEHCKSLRNKYRKGSSEFNYYSAVLNHLESTGFRCMMVDNYPAICPDLSNWSASSNGDSNLLSPSNNASISEQLVSSKTLESAAGSEVLAPEVENQDADLSDKKLEIARILKSEGYSKTKLIQLLWGVSGGSKFTELSKLLDN